MTTIPSPPLALPWRIRVSKAVRDSKIEIIGQEDVKNESHANTLIAVLMAYGASRQGFVYVEPYLARKAIRPHDILLCHPDVGVLVIEVKGHGIEDIVRVAAGNLFVKVGVNTTSKNAFKQAETTMFDVKTAVERAGGPRSTPPIFDFVVALPRISEQEWTAKRYDQSLDRSRLLLKDDLASGHRLRLRLEELTKAELSRLHRSKPIEAEHFDRVKSVFGDSAVINTTRTARDNVVEDSIGGLIEYVEGTDKNLSAEQQELSRLPVGGHPRVIRGVAGSGKTVVLANMVARYLSRRLSEAPESAESTRPRIAVVCFNRSLVPFLHARIRDAFGDDFDTNAKACLTISHLNDLMYYLPFGYVKVDTENAAARANYYKEHLAALKSSDPAKYEATIFDVVFVDEGQDFLPEEHQLLLDLVRPNAITSEKPLIIFYDNAQNVYARPQPTWSAFGIDVARGDRTRVMKQCFRNTRQIVELGFNVLYGSQARGVVKTRTFLDLDTLRNSSLISESASVVRVHFADRDGAEPFIKSFSSRAEEREWMTGEITRLVVEEYVRPSDILVLFRTDYDFEDLPAMIEEKLGPDRIKGFLRVFGKNAPDKDSYLIRDDHLTLSTIASAKGYDCPVVFLADLDRFEETSTDRALFYVGATRAKHMLYLLGLRSRSGQNTLLDEARLAQKALLVS